MAIYFFDKNQTLIKTVPESATFEAIQTQELDDDSLLKDTLSVTVKGDEKLLYAEYMAVKSYTGNAQTFDMYRIVTDTTPDKTMSFTGMSLAPYELNGHIIQDLRPANHSLEYTLNRVLIGTDWHLGYIDSDLSNVTTTFYYVSAKEALKELQSLVGCEFIFKVEISGQKITDKWIEVYSEMGNRTKKRFNYGTNALTVVRETNKADIYTALIGRGKGEEVSSADENESGQAGYGRKITFEDIEWSTNNGNPLNKPIGQYYLELPQATQVYGIKNIDGTMSARVGIVDFDDEEDKNRVINLTYQQLLVSSRPKVLFKTTVANIGATGIGDTVTIHRHDINVHYEIRVRKIVRNRLNDNKTQIELGDAVVTPSTKQAKQNNATIKNLNNEIEKIKANVTTSPNSADGKNTIFYGSVEPERQRTGDTWYRPHPSIAGETQMLTWNGTAWELVIDTSDLTSVVRKVEEASNKADEAVQSAKDAGATANSAIEKAGANFDLIDEHKKRLDSLRVGGRNLLKNSNFDTDEYWTPVYHDYTVENNVLKMITRGTSPASSRIETVVYGLDEGIYTVSARAKSTSRLLFKNFANATVANKTYVDTNNEWTIFSSQFSVLTNGVDVTVRLYLEDGSGGQITEVDWMKLEKGTMATDWTPAPEDIDAEFNTVSGEITQMRNDLSAVSDTAQSSLNIIGIDSGNMYTKNRRLGLKSQEINKGGTAKVQHNGNGFEIGQVYTLSFKASCLIDSVSNWVERTRTETIQYERTVKEDNSIFEKDSYIQIQGVNGSATYSWSVEVKDGTETGNRTDEIRTSYTPPINEVYIKGTKTSSVVNFTIKKLLQDLSEAKVVMLGDSITMGYGRTTKIPDVVKNELGAQSVQNAGYGSTTAALHPNKPELRKIGFTKLVDSIVSGSWSEVLNADLSGISYATPQTYKQSLTNLSNTNFNNVDAVIIMYGTNDWAMDVKLDNSSNQQDQSTYLGALRYGINKLQQAYPHLEILVAQPILWTMGSITSEGYNNSIGLKVRDYANGLNNTLNIGVPVAQTYNKGITTSNYTNYFNTGDSSDGTHPNSAGNSVIGKLIASEFERLIDISPAPQTTSTVNFIINKASTSTVNFEINKGG
ncbi:phage tail spike protein [Jeotgalibaca porci]|uniref:phage tail spike protein n=1 Tax=Jeotgalibaca porci TaxID=1868793 RepID=UPI0035A11A1A